MLYKLIFLIPHSMWLLITLILNAKIISSLQVCEQKYELTNILGVPIKGNFFNAIQICHLMGLQLVTPDTAKMNGEIVKYIEAYGLTDIWTTGNDLGDEGRYNWLLNGKHLNYSNWSFDQPEGGLGENCIEIWYRDDVYQWNDRDCMDYLNIVCERKLPTTCKDDDVIYQIPS